MQIGLDWDHMPPFPAFKLPVVNKVVIEEKGS
jgi:hypothetical protein